MVVPPNYGPLLKTLDLPSVGEFQQRVEERAEEVDLSLASIDQLVHKARQVER